MEKEKGKSMYSITWLRAFAVICILLCHLVVQHSNAYVTMLGQFFNVGTQIFILISGFLFGMREFNSVKKWYGKRIKRIFVPYWIFIAILLITFSLTNTKYSLFHLILLTFGLQGSNVHILGAEQTWFISVILICYLITPMLYKMYDRSNLNNKYICLIFIMPIIFALFKSPAVYTLLSPVVLYMFGFILGKYKNKICIKSWICFMLMIIMFIVRLGSKLLFDGTILYDRIVVVYTQSIIAICILMLFLHFFDKKVPYKAISFIDNYSFEIYLVHYMFVVGPVSLMKLTGSWLLNSIIVILISFAFAIVIKYLSNLIYGVLDRKQN